MLTAKSNKQSLLLCLVPPAGLIPLLFKIPYLLQAWNHSPLDRYDWIFVLLFLSALSAALRPLLSRRTENLELMALLIAVPSIFALLASAYKDIHALWVVASVLFAWSTLWLAFGWKSAYCILPSYGILMLICPGISYWLNFFTGSIFVNGQFLKWVLCLFLLVWQFINLELKNPPKRQSVLFYMAAAVMVLLLWQRGSIQIKYRTFLPDFSSLTNADHLGIETEITAADRRFFAGSTIKKYLFLGENGPDVNILEVQCSKNVHQIHPAGHCLRTGNWQVLTERPKQEVIGGYPVAITEITAMRNGKKILVWSWFSCDEFSTGNFLGFRRNWTRRARWYAYQISVPFKGEELEESRNFLRSFLERFPQRPH